MGGFNTLVRDFNEATCELHLTSPDGSPAYAVYRGESLDIATGDWKEPKKNKELTDEGEVIRVAVPPKVDGAEVKPCVLLVRSPASPDAERFRETHKCKVSVMTIVGLDNDDEGKPIKYDDDEFVSFWASFIAGFQDLPYENEKGETVLAEYSEETAIDFVKTMPGISVQLRRMILNVKNFKRSTT